MKKILEPFEDVTVCLGPKIQSMQEIVQKMTGKFNVQKQIRESVSSSGASASIPPTPYPESAVHSKSIKKFTEATNISMSKTDHPNLFNQVNFESVLKRANVNTIIETEDKESASKLEYP